MGSEIDGYAVALIRCKAKQLIRRAEFKGMDSEDLEQEMMLDLLQRLPQYDVSRASRNTFIARVVEHKVATLIEFYRVPRRDPGGLVHTLFADIRDAAAGDDSRGAARGKVYAFDEAASRKRLGEAVRLEDERRDERLDVESVIEGLPEDLRQLAEHLRSKTPWEIAKKTGIPRTNLYRAIEKLRKKFQEAGLEEIFLPSRTFGRKRR